MVVPMTREEVRSAIVEPARLARLDVADGLVELLLSDLAPRSPDVSLAGAGHEAGALPLLSHALLTTWSRRHGGRLTVADYQASGGIRHAIAQTADQVYESLDEEQRDIARRLFLRLVYVADDAPETRSSVRLDELRDWPDETAIIRRGARPFRRRTADHPGRRHRADHPRGPAHRVAPAAHLDRREPGGPAGPAAAQRRRADLGRGRAGSRGPAPGRPAGAGPGLDRRPAQPGQPQYADPGVRGRGDRGGTTPAGRGTQPHGPAAPPRRGAQRAGRADRRAGRVRLPATPGSDPRAGQRDGRQEHRAVARGGRRSRSSTRAECRAGGPAQPGRLPDRADRRGAGQPAGVVRQPGRGPAARFGRCGRGRQPQPRSSRARGGGRGRHAAAVGRGPARPSRRARHDVTAQEPQRTPVHGGVQPGRPPPRGGRGRPGGAAVERGEPGSPGPAPGDSGRAGQHGVLAGLQPPAPAAGRGQRRPDRPAVEPGRPGPPGRAGQAPDRAGRLRAVGGVQPGRPLPSPQAARTRPSGCGTCPTRPIR